MKIGTVVVGFLIALGLTVGVAVAQENMFCNIPTPDFYKICQDQEFMKNLTPEQKKEVDKEWQRRVPKMTPAERNLYYPEGFRYYPGG